MCAIGSKLLILKMVIPPLIVNSYNGHLNPHKVHDYPIGKQWELNDPGAYEPKP